VEQDVAGTGVHPGVTTEDLLAEAGYRCMLDWPMDDQLVSMQTRMGRRSACPFRTRSTTCRRWYRTTARRASSPTWRSTMSRRMLLLSNDRPLLYGIMIDTFIVGQPFRLRQLRRVTEYINRARDQAWFTTAGRAAQRYAAQLQPPAAQVGNTPR
jgi:allantoinase